MNDFPYLSALVAVPAVGAAVAALLPARRPDVVRAWALGTSLVVAALAGALLVAFDSREAGYQFLESKRWIEAFGARYLLGVDGISLFMVALTALLFPVSLLASVGIERRVKAYHGLMLVLEAGIMGIFLSVDLFLFFVFWEGVLVPMYFIIGAWGYERRIYAALKFFLYTAAGSALLLVGILTLAFLHARAPGGELTFDLRTLVEWDGLSPDTARWLFLAFFASFAVKVPLFPFHTWLPDAHTEAPTVGSVLLAAILLKLGTYGFVRISLPILPEAAIDWAPWIGLLAVIGIIYGALACLAQRDMKRLIAFSSVAHMGFVMLGISTLTDFGINAAIFGMVAHGIITGMLFFLAGSVQERFGTRELSRLGGLLVQAPRLGWILGYCTMASLGLPGLAGFWGEFPAILSAYQPAAGLPEETFRTFMVAAAIGTVLAAGYLLWMLQRVAMSRVPAEWSEAHVHDVHVPEWFAWAPLLVFILGLGVYPHALFRLTDGAVQGLTKVFGG